MRNYKNYSIVLGWLKELLHNYNLPMVPVFTENTIPYDGRVYIKDNQVVKCSIDDNGNTTYNFLSEYTDNHEVLNLTKNFTINSSTYDQHTHNYLGDYLRYLRDYKKINLMGLYNCFNYNQPSRIYHTMTLQTDAAGNHIKSYEINTNNKLYTYYAVPIKFNQIYTIAIDSASDYDLVSVLYSNKFISNTPDDLIKESLKVVGGSQFTNPFLYSTYFSCAKDYWQKEKDLVLLIKVPKRFNSTITILEGNFVECSNTIDGSIITNYVYNEDKLPSIYYGKLSLLEYNNHISYPFADRLIEFLLKNVIDSTETIPLNIARVQEELYQNGIRGFYDIWSDLYIRNKIKNISLNVDLTKGRNSRWSNTIAEQSLWSDPVVETNSEGNITSWERSSIDQFGSQTKEYKKIKTFRDSYNDLTYYIDKDVETLINSINLFKSHIKFSDATDDVYVVYGWDLDKINVSNLGDNFKGYYSSDDKGVTLKDMYYDANGFGVKKWDIKEAEVTLYAKY